MFKILLNLKYNPDTGEINSAGIISDTLMDDLLMDFASFLVADDFNQVAEQVFPREKNVNKIDNARLIRKTNALMEVVG